MKKAVLIVVGVLVMLLGLAFFAGGLALLVLFGGDGQIESGAHPFVGNGTALVSAATTIVHSSPIDAGGGIRLRVSAEPTNGKEVFIGVGPADDVDRYLAGAPVDEISHFQLRPFKLETTATSGEAVPPNPNDQDFWRVSASSTVGAEIDWKVEPGTFRVVMMNVDSSPGVQANVRLGVKVPFTVPAGITLLVLGLLLGGLGVFLLVLGIRSPMPQPPQPMPYPSASGLPPGAPLPPPSPPPPPPTG